MDKCVCLWDSPWEEPCKACKELMEHYDDYDMLLQREHIASIKDKRKRDVCTKAYSLIHWDDSNIVGHGLV